MRIFFDTEFIDDGKTVDLISIGLVRDDGETYYAESSECDHSRACEWVQKNVIRHLVGPMKSRLIIAEEIKEFCGKSPQFWTYFGSYDWLCLCQLYGRMIDTPPDWPNFQMDIMNLLVLTGRTQRELPEQSGQKHNALADAQWTKNAYMHLVSVQQ